MSANAGNIQYFVSDEFDLAGGGTQQIGNTGGDTKKFAPTKVTAFIISQSGVVVSGTVSAGTNSPDYDNIAPPQLVGGVGNLIANLNLSASIVEIPTSTDMKTKFTGPTGISPHQNVRVEVEGIRIP